ncbi:MAG: Stealth CR1 domain-containing protein, partial [Propionibacteriaceae bacterium]|nr:Stealth CR1 domain-containing protein [Propionibacteriaceae bacterium]
VDFPIDVVYMWVDGDDPVWQARMRQAQLAGRDDRPASPAGADDPPRPLADEAGPDEPGSEEAGAADLLELGAAEPDGAGTAEWRFRTRDELRYSMRSIEMYAPGVNHVYLVADDQAPRWLDLDSQFVTLVRHREIFRDPSLLPVFNSHAIGSQLHHIPGLTEHYLIMNDDMLLQSVVAPELFFGPGGLAKFRPSNGRRRLVERGLATDLELARLNSSEWLSDQFQRTYSNFFTHTPVPQVRSVAYELEERFPDLYASVAASKFRGPEDHELNSWFLLYYLLSTGRATRSDLLFAYHDLSKVGRAKVENDLKRRDIQVVCLNDGPTDSSVDTAWVKPLLGRYFGRTASFELPEPDWREAVSWLAAPAPDDGGAAGGGAGLADGTVSEADGGMLDSGR